MHGLALKVPASSQLVLQERWLAGCGRLLRLLDVVRQHPQLLRQHVRQGQLQQGRLLRQEPAPRLGVQHSHQRGAVHDNDNGQDDQHLDDQLHRPHGDQPVQAAHQLVLGLQARQPGRRHRAARADVQRPQGRLQQRIPLQAVPGQRLIQVLVVRPGRGVAGLFGCLPDAVQELRGRLRQGLPVRVFLAVAKQAARPPHRLVRDRLVEVLGAAGRLHGAECRRQRERQVWELL
jgi:hypothetical protein